MTSEQHNLRVDAAIFPSSYSPQRGSLGFDQTKRLTLTGWKLWSPVIGVSSSVLKARGRGQRGSLFRQVVHCREEGEVVLQLPQQQVVERGREGRLVALSH